MSVLIVAFDGVLASTLDARTDAIMEATGERRVGTQAAAPDHVPDRPSVRALIPGRTLREVMRLILPAADELALDLFTMRAQQLVHARLAHGLVMSSGIRELIDRARAAGTPVVLRSDSARRDVEPVLALTALEVAFTFLRCADDPAGNVRGAPAIVSSYADIARRLDSRGIAVSDRVAWESGAFAASAAQPYVDRVHVHDALD